ncbi:MAG: hypothetical protein IJV35_03890 [Neisseriaceae bacterium]|nr:hypothetical protein [Neisseriaceae bacterium]
MNCDAIHWIATPLQATARNDTVFNILKLLDYNMVFRLPENYSSSTLIRVYIYGVANVGCLGLF